MKDWVLPYLKEKDPRTSEKLLQEIKRADFNFFDEEEDIFFDEKHRKHDTYLDVIRPLTDQLNCHFEPAVKFQCSNCQKFAFMFISVLASLPKDTFDRLCRSKNTFFIYSPSANAYIKRFDLGELNMAIDENADLKIIVFNHEIATFPWLLARYCIMRELGRTLLSSNDDDYVNEKLKEWGFEKEMDKANEFEAKRREAISKFYAF